MLFTHRGSIAKALAEPIAHLQSPSAGVPCAQELSFTPCRQPPRIFDLLCAAHRLSKLVVRFRPGAKRLDADLKSGGDLGLAAAFRSEFKNAFAIRDIIKGRAPACSRRQDFEIGAHETSQDVTGIYSEKRSAIANFLWGPQT